MSDTTDWVAALTADDAAIRTRAAAVLTHRGRWARGTAAALSQAVATDPSPAVRRAALGAIARRGHPTRALAAWLAAAHDADAEVRRVAMLLAPDLQARYAHVVVAGVGARALDDIVATLTAALDDTTALAAEAAAFALGEVVPAHEQQLPGAVATAVGSLVRHAGDHADPLVREACVAALGAIGAPEALPTILAAAKDKPAIRRRAVIALSAYTGPEVDRALQEALTDRDWQVRQLAEDLTTSS